MDWDDLRYVLSIYDNGSALAAAQQLKVNPSTVQRRIDKFEKQNHVRLFDRLQSGYRPTQECEILVQASRDIDDSIKRLGREILGRDLLLEGRLRITSTDTLITSVVARHLDGFHKLNPNITLELSITNSRLNLLRQDAEIAIRPSFDPQDRLVGQQVANLSYGIYAAADLAASLPESPDLADLVNLSWIKPGESFRGSTSYDWINQHIPSTSYWLSVDTYPSMAACAVQSLGLAVLPCMMADTIRELYRIQCPWFQLTTPVWVVTHPEIRNAARIRAFMDYITQALRNDWAVLDGNATVEADIN